MHNAECRMQNAECRMLNAECFRTTYQRFAPHCISRGRGKLQPYFHGGFSGSSFSNSAMREAS
jgi:hypothetical protein